MTLPPSIDRVIAAAWGRGESTKKGPKPSLQLTDVIEAAVEIADVEGLGAVSMSRVAKKLGFTTMSVYRYVESKDELLTHMQDAAMGAPDPTVAVNVDWREGLEVWARSLFRHQQQHRWSVDIPVGAAPLMPNAVAWMDWALQYLHRMPLAPIEKLSALLLLSGYVRNEVSQQLSLERGRSRSWRENIEDAASEDAVYVESLRQLIDAQSHPAVAELLNEGMFFSGETPEVEDGDTFMFDFGLQRILDGLEHLIDSRS